MKRLALAAAVALVSVNIWTGGPLAALWIGSRFQGSGPPKMESIFVVAVVLGAISLALLKLLGVLGAAYEDASGQTSTVRTHVPWLRSMRGERERYEGEAPRLTAVERIVVVMVVIAVLAFEVWFFFFSTSPIDQRSGRGALPEPTPVVALHPAPAPR